MEDSGSPDLGSNPRGTTNSVEIILPQVAARLEILFLTRIE